MINEVLCYRCPGREWSYQQGWWSYWCICQDHECPQGGGSLQGHDSQGESQELTQYIPLHQSCFKQYYLHTSGAAQFTPTLGGETIWNPCHTVIKLIKLPLCLWFTLKWIWNFIVVHTVIHFLMSLLYEALSSYIVCILEYGNCTRCRLYWRQGISINGQFIFIFSVVFYD